MHVDWKSNYKHEKWRYLMWSKSCCDMKWLERWHNVLTVVKLITNSVTIIEDAYSNYSNSSQRIIHHYNLTIPTTMDHQLIALYRNLNITHFNGISKGWAEEVCDTKVRLWYKLFSISHWVKTGEYWVQRLKEQRLKLDWWYGSVKDREQRLRQGGERKEEKRIIYSNSTKCTGKWRVGW